MLLHPENFWALTLRQLLVILLITGLLGCAAVNGEADDSHDRSGDLYAASPNPMAQVDVSLDRALENNKLLLIVLGANWCHDSRALAARLGEAPLEGVIEQRYETVLVDVGYYESGMDVVQRFAAPIIYATPTVLVVDPQTELLVNAFNRHQWGNAHNISMDESVAYFSDLPDRAPVLESSAQLDRLMAEIDAHEAMLAERVASAYAYIGPRLKRLDQDGRAPDNFDQDWKAIAEFRNAIPGDMDALRRQAMQRVADGEQDIVLQFPDYPEFTARW